MDRLFYVLGNVSPPKQNYMMLFVSINFNLQKNKHHENIKISFQN